MVSLIRLLIFFISIGVFSCVIFFVTPPKSWSDAGIFQIMAFFLPLLFMITFFIDFGLHYLPHSFIISLGIILFLAFYGVDQLNILTGLLSILIVLLSWRLFPKMKLPRLRLTREPKIPKLHLQKKEAPKLRGLRRLK